MPLKSLLASPYPGTRMDPLQRSSPATPTGGSGTSKRVPPSASSWEKMGGWRPLARAGEILMGSWWFEFRLIASRLLQEMLRFRKRRAEPAILVDLNVRNGAKGYLNLGLYV